MLVVPLKGTNYPSWKIQCRMALIREGLWGIVAGTERPPNEATEADQYAKYMSRRDRALATIVLVIDPSLLYLIGDPEDPAVVWTKLSGQFQKKTWANKLSLRKRLFTMKLSDSGSMREYIRKMTEIFDELAVVAEPVSEEDKVVYLLAGLPESYDVLVTALESGSDTVPALESVTERLLREEHKLKDREEADDSKKLLVAKGRRPLTCHYCKKPGHFKKDCWKFAQAQGTEKSGKHKNPSRQSKREHQSSQDAMVISNALVAKSRNDWIVDSGATSHMCNNRNMFVELSQLGSGEKVTLGDGSSLDVAGEGTVDMDMILRDGTRRGCALKKVLYVPELAYNLISVVRAGEAGKTVCFDELGCEFRNDRGDTIALGVRQGSLYYLKFAMKSQNSASVAQSENKERLWHRRFGHLNEQSMEKLVKKQLVSQLDYDTSGDVGVCEACIGGKQCKSSFKPSKTVTSMPLELVHSDVCGKMGRKSMGGAEYFLTLLDDKTHYAWVYPLKTKGQAFERFKQWQAEVENLTGQRVKTLRTDNGGEFTSKSFQAHLKACGIRHELTIPKTPEQNGVAERLNRTLVETTRAMLLDAKLPQKFWAEAISTAAYLRNRSPTSAVEGTTPHQAWYGQKPRVEHLRVFGCVAYVHVPKDERGKLDSKTKKCVLLGYGSVQKGYRIYDRLTQKVFYSRNVKFDEREIESPPVEEEEPAQRPLILDPVGEPESDREAGDEENGGTNADPPDAAEPPPRRSARKGGPVDYYGFPQVHLTIHSEPTTFEEATGCPEKAKWKEAMGKEIKSLKDNKVWELTTLPPGKKGIGCKWVYKVKTNSGGSIERYKARLVARGFDQKFGSDYDETFCPVVRLESLRTLIALSSQRGLELHHVDVQTAFLNGTLQEDIYMKQPEGYEKQGEEDLVCKLSKSIYGLKQSSRCWNTALDAHLKRMGFAQLKSDPCIYASGGEDTFYIGVYVDDMILAGKNEAKMRSVKEELTSRFDIKDLGKLSYFLGMSIVQDQEKKETWIGQPTYAEKLLTKMGMSDCKPVKTPADPANRLVKAAEDEQAVDQQLYQSLVGGLMYLATCTRPDIAYTVGMLARFSSKPNQTHWVAAKRVLRYLKGTMNFGLIYSGDPGVLGYSDADWAGDMDDRKSTSGYMFQIAGGPVSWRSKKQDTVALSTAEAEYVALSSAAQECVWMRRLVSELGNPPGEPTTILEDNQSSIAMARNPQFHGRAKHIDIKHHFVREQVSSGMIELKYCPTGEMVADILTKGLPQQQFSALREMAGMVPQKTGTEP